VACRRGDLKGDGDANRVLGRSPRGLGRNESAALQDPGEGSPLEAAPEKEVEGFRKVFEGLFASGALGADVQQRAGSDEPAALAGDLDRQFGFDVDREGLGHF